MTLLVVLAAVSGLFYAVGVRTGRIDPAGTLALGLWSGAAIFALAALYAA